MSESIVMKRVFVFILVCFAMSGLQAANCSKIFQEDENVFLQDTIREDLKLALHPKIRVTPYPNISAPRLNPASLLWPATSKNGKYVVELSRSENFSKIEKKSGVIEWACYNPHEKLSKGTWYWRVKEVGAANAKVKGPYRFEVGDQPLFITPQVDGFLKNIPTGYPRILSSPDNLPKVRERIKGTLLEQEILTNAEKFLNVSALPFSDVIHPPVGNFKPHEAEQLLDVQVLNWLQTMQVECMYLSTRFLLTGEAQYAQAAIKRALSVAQIDRKYSKSSDFSQGKFLDIYIYVLDNCYYQLTDKQRSVLINEIHYYANHFYQSFTNYLEIHVYENHIWQKTLVSLLKAGLITYKKIPDAEKWLKYCYEVWSCRAPMGGFELQGGGITEGTSYLTADMVTLIQMPTLLNRYSGFNFYSHPWFKKAPYSLLMNWPVNSYSNGFGDGHGSPTNPRWQQAMLIKVLSSANKDQVASWFYQQMLKDPRCLKPRKYEAGSKHPLDTEFVEWFATAENIDSTEPVPPQNLSAAVFSETGTSVIHTNYNNVKENVFVAFNASAYGSGSHSQCDQNAFNIIAGGVPLFLSSGYYTNFSDKHNLLHYRSSRGHNTILADGLSQTLGGHGYGNILRFHQTEDYVYILGDASNAYNGKVTDPMWIENMKKSGVSASRENGYGRAGVKRFYRHILFIKPSTLVVYDDLEANEPITWTWLLHGRNIITGENNLAEISNGIFKGKMQLFSTTGFKAEINDQFEEPAINWMSKKLELLENHWHFRATTPKSKFMKFFAVFQIEKEGQGYKLLQINSGSVSGLGQLNVSAAMIGDGRLQLKQGEVSVLDASVSNTKVAVLGTMQVLEQLPVVSSR